MIIIDEDTVQFKSTDEHWHVEKDGIKPNTVRYIDMVDEMELLKCDLKYISLVHNKTGHTFHRKLTDMTCATIRNHPVFIFSWDKDKFVQKDSITLINHLE